MQTDIGSNHRRDILILAFSIVGLAGLTGCGIFFLVISFSAIPFASATDLPSSLFAAIAMFGCAGLLLPLLISCIRRLKGREIHPAKLPPAKAWQVICLAVLWISTIVLGTLINNQPGFWRLTALPFFLLGIVIPIAVLAWVAIGGLPTGSSRRLWAAFGIGMTGSTLGAMLLEYSLVGIAILAAGIFAASNPEWYAIFQQIRNQVTNSNDVQSLITTLAPYLTNSFVLLLALIFVSVIAPMIEETLKPAAVWLLGKRLRSPAEGFALGALCGAGFALLEGSLAASGSYQYLGIGIATRAASSLMHITASGLLGWGIASVRLEKRYLRLAGMYLLSIFIHGLWNGSVILAVFGALRLALPGASADPIGMVFVIAGIGILGSMLLAIMILLPVINHRLRPLAPVSDTTLQSDIIAPPQP